MDAKKKVNKSGGITLPRGIRQETGILPGVPVDIRTDEEGIHISKHVPTCHCCGTVDDVQKVWKKFLERKDFYDLSGNGVNHPNDYGHRIYASVLLHLLAGAEMF